MERNEMNRTSYFQNINSLCDLRKQYKKLIKQFHPDNGGSEETVKTINIEYESLFATLKQSESKGYNNTAFNNKSKDKAFRDALNAIINLNVNIEICGSWIWVTGQTYPVKETLKANGFRFSRNKRSWYWHGKEYARFGKKSYTMEDIRNLHGPEKVKTYEETFINA